MEQNAPTASPNRMIVILLGVIVVLLLAIVVYLAFAGGTKTATTTDKTGTTGTTGTTATTGTSAAFDPATATKVPAGETPEQYTKAYFDAVVAKDYVAAYDRLPTDKKAQSDQAAFSAQLDGYGVTGYTIDNVTEEGNEAKVTATATMPGGNFQYLWTFVKDGDGWLVKSRTLPGMGQ